MKVEAKKPRGRPTKANNATSRVEFRATPAEKERYLKAAHKANLKLSAWLKFLADKNS